MHTDLIILQLVTLSGVVITRISIFTINCVCKGFSGGRGHMLH